MFNGGECNDRHVLFFFCKDGLKDTSDELGICVLKICVYMMESGPVSFSFLFFCFFRPTPSMPFSVPFFCSPPGYHMTPFCASAPRLRDATKRRLIPHPYSPAEYRRH